MKVINKAREVPFFLTVGVLFVIAVAHLGIQIWGSPSQRSPVSALEAPVVAPKISSPTSPAEPEAATEEPPAEPSAEPPAEPAAEPPAEPAADAPDDSSAGIGDPGEPGPPPVPAPEAKPAPEVKPEPVTLKAPAKAPETKKETPKPEKKPSAKPPKSVSEPKKDASESAVTVVKAEPLKPARKSSKKAKRVQVEPQTPEYQTPPEWNWFSKPMAMVFNGTEWVLATEENSVQPSEKPVTGDEKIVVAPADAVEPVSEKAPKADSAPAPVSMEAPVQEPVTAAPEVRDSQPEVVALQKPQAAPEVAAAPFERALAKMAARKAKRIAEAERLHVNLPSSGGANKMVPGSLIKMIDVLGEMGGQSSASETGAIGTTGSNSVPGAATEPLAPVAGAEPAPGAELAPVTPPETSLKN